MSGPAGTERWTGFRLLELALAVGGVAAVLAVFVRFLARVEQRPGVVLPDPVLALFAARDVTWLTFTVIYGAIVLGLVTMASRPSLLILALRAYAILIIFRMTTMAVTPFDPPFGTLPLRDPLVEGLGTRTLLTRDLFFSGHTGTLFLLALCARSRILRVILVGATVAVAACVLWQKVHYTVDVLAAPVFAYAACRVARATAPVTSRP